jgi:hypothetical protein
MPEARSPLDFEIFCRRLSSVQDLVLDDLALVQTRRPALSAGGEVDEDIIPAVLRWDEPVSLL